MSFVCELNCTSTASKLTTTLAGGSPLVTGRQHVQIAQSDSSSTMDPTLHHSGPSTMEPLTAGASAAPLVHSREPSVARGRVMEASITTASNGILPQQAVRTPSPYSQTTVSGSFRPARGIEGGLERKPSYGHHRQTSIVHGVQHSRNASFVNSPETSPLSTHMVAATSDILGNGVRPHMGHQDLPDSHTGNVLPVNNIFSTPTYSMTSTLANDRDTPDSTNGTLTQRRLERMHSGKVRREHAHHHSHSKPHHHPQEWRTVGEYALHHLFNSFIGQADNKIMLCVNNPSDPDYRVEQVCGPGVDPSFDQLISALGHIARQKPKPLIDTLMFWRKAKGENVNNGRTDGNPQRPLPPMNGSLLRRNTEPLHTVGDSIQSNMGLHEATSPLSMSRQEAILRASRKESVANYLLCRALMEIYNQSTLEAITSELAARLEDVIFIQMKGCDPEQLAASSFRMANWTIFGQVLGVMSGINFESVSDRFIADLERSQKDLGTKGSVNKDVEGKVELTIMGMRHLRVKVYPEDAWDRSCDFMQSLGRFFVNAHGQRIKHAYCQTLERLLLPIAAKASTELNVPKWKEVLSVINPRLVQMLAKPRHWLEVFPLFAITLCVSPTEVFSAQWLSVISSLQPKLKDRSTRGTALQAICRLVWTYLYRATDTLNVTTRKLEEVMKMVFPPGKKTYLSTEPAVAESLIQLFRIIGFKHQDFCFRTIIFPLINSELFVAGKDLKVEQLEPEKMVIGIRAFLAIMSDLEKGEQGRPPFPQTFYSGSVVHPLPKSPVLPSPPLLAEARPSLDGKEERLSQPVVTKGFSDVAREYYARFCEVLGKITIICDNTFGGQAVLDEKFSVQTPKTPIAETFSFSRKDEHQSIAEQKQGFYDLLHVAVQALPRCLSVHVPFNSLINLLCTGTAHVQGNIAASSAASLKSIARQLHAQPVTIGFARFIFNFDARYFTMADEGMLGPGHIENTLKLYVELLQIWIEEIKQRTKDAVPEPLEDSTTSNRALQLDLSAVLAHVEEIESHGLFFLCSQSRRVRGFAVTVLRIITEFDTALGKDNTRIIRILEGDSQRVMDFNDEQLSVAERSRLQKGKRKSGSHNTLIELCSSDVSYDSTLWFKIFPNLIRISFETCPFAVTLGREIVCARLLQMHQGILTLAEAPRGPQYNAFDPTPTRLGSRLTSSPPEVTIEQWKLYLIMACTTLTNAGGQTQSQLANAQHARKTSKGSQQGQDKIGSARSLFAFIIPLLSAGSGSIRDAIVVALGSININLYRTLLESLQYAVTTCNEEAKMRIGNHQRTASGSRRNRRTDRLRTEVTHVYKLTAHFLHERDVYNDDWILNNLITYTKDLRLFLSDADVQNDWEFQKLRRHYCGLMEELFEGINRTSDPARWMSFESRKSAFALMEDWCGYSPNQEHISHREDSMRQLALDQQRDSGEKGNATAAMEIEKRNLRTAALSAMASLCGGPISITTESRANLQFDVRRMLSWIDTIFSTVNDKMHLIGRRALKNLITHNREYPYLLERSIQMCYLVERPKALESYFDVVIQVLTEYEDYPIAFWRILGAILFTLGNGKSIIRMRSARLLRILEERQQKSSKIQDFDISISDKTTAVYKLAQFEISKRLCKQHSDLAFYIFSEFSLHFKVLQPDHQRNMVAAILPWVQTINLQLDPNGGPTTQSYMLLANLLEITIKSSDALHNEVQALWQALATGPHGGNVQLVLDFIISLCLDKREQNFVDYVKQIVVFLSGTPAGQKVVEFLLLQITPRNMVQEKREPSVAPTEALGLPYIADLSLALPVGNKQSGYSLGQLSLIFLVDLMVAPVNLAPEYVPLVLQVVLILWDHYTSLVQEQAREMLVHLIHELVISKIEDQATTPNKKSIEDFVESIRQHDPKVVWVYDESNGKDDDESGNRVPTAMTYITGEVVSLFAIAYPAIREQWAKTTLSWATSCPVRHLACRSFQIFRCILTSLDQSMLADMLARLSNTIADDFPNTQTFSMEILTTLKTIIAALEPLDLLKYPQLFWATCACLNTVHEREFVESLAMLENFLNKIDLNQPGIVQLLMDNQPPRWEGDFDGVQPIVYRGLKSSVSLERTLRVLQKLTPLPNCELVGDSSRLLFAVFANLPRFLHYFDTNVKDTASIECAETLVKVAEAQGCPHIARSLNGFANGRYRTSKDFLAQSVSAIRSSFFPELDFQSLVFMMGLLTNRLPWFKLKTMEILCVIIPDVDTRRPEIAKHGADLISPLLRLLQTEFCPQALEVMDHIMMMSATPMDKHHIRMSMASSSSTALRKEYERTQSLYGIPEDTGWSIPAPAIHSNTTRNNVHAVFYTCAAAATTDAEAVPTPEIEFYSEDIQAGSYFALDRTATMVSMDETQGDGNMGDLVSKLDSLDDFFEDNLISDKVANHYSGNTIVTYSGEPDVGASLYDQQTLPILHRSLARTESYSFFQNGFADVKGPGARDPGVMTPTAFTAPAMPPVRPPMHARSVTSPVNNLPSATGTDLLSDHEADEVFSDDERSTAHGAPRDAPYFLESMIRGTRSGMRRLTGGGGRDGERQRDLLRTQKKLLNQTSKSPRVPKVPDAYLQNPHTSPGM